MKWIVLAFALFTVKGVEAQMKKNTNAPASKTAWITSYAAAVPLSSGEPAYDTTIRLAENMTREILEQNANQYFEKTFSTGYVNKNKKHNYTALGTYSFSLNDNADDQELYTVNYIMDISIKDGKYDVSLHNFTIEHLAANVDMDKKIAAASRGDAKARMLMAYFQRNNLAQLKQVYQSMSAKNMQMYANK